MHQPTAFGTFNACKDGWAMVAWGNTGNVAHVFKLRFTHVIRVPRGLTTAAK
jgi:hypothetical protein